ncbi:MAG: carboxypeptidase-like regulatory domain-containing protein [Actinomycetes bacterium]
MRRLVVAVAFGLTGLFGLTGCGAGEPDLVATVSGIVEQGPTCPVETLDSPCPPAPAVGARVDVLQKGTVVASTTTDADGRFQLTAPAGTVEVRATSTDGLPSQDAETFTLGAGDDVEARLLLDTGIR